VSHDPSELILMFKKMLLNILGETDACFFIGFLALFEMEIFYLKGFISS